MFWTTKLRPLKVFSWKLLNSWWNAAKLMSNQGPLYLRPSSYASLVSGLNWRSAPEATTPWQPTWVGETQMEPKPASGGVPGVELARNSADRSRLNPPAL